MKKLLIVFISVVFLFSAFGCNSLNNKDDKLSVVVTIYPIYDWVNEIIGEDSCCANITLLLDNGNDMHSYEPSLEDTTKILDADLFIYVGGESDEWVRDVLDKNKDNSLKVINIMHVLEEKLLEEEIKEGMDGHDHDDCTDEDCDHDHEHEHEEVELDEHVWLSLKNAIEICNEIESCLSNINESKKSEYKENLEDYTNKLNTLDSQYKTVVSNATKDCLLFADRFPFRYLVNDYNIDYFAAFVGCSTATEASTQTITFLIDKVVELKLDVILVIDGSDETIAKTIKADAIKKDSTRENVKILTINSLQAVNIKNIDNEFSYLSVMKSNLEVLKEALS